MGQRNTWASVRSDTRGASLVEYIVLVGLVALVALGGFRAFGAAALDKVNAQADCVATFSCGPGNPQGAGPAVGTDGAAVTAGDPFVGNPPFGDIGAANQHTAIPGQPTIIGEGDGTAVHPNDISQGQLGDCYLLASMGAIALQNRSIIENAIRDNGDGTYTVTFYQRNNHPGWQFWKSDYDKVEITVNNEFATDANGNPVFAQPGDGEAGNRELWPMIVEKAYAQWKGGYQQIGHGGWMAEPLEALTGQPSRSSGGDMSMEDLANAFDNGDAVTVGTGDPNGPLFDNGTLVGAHAYFVTNVDRGNNTVTLHNPWGWDRGDITITYQQYVDHFIGYATNPADD
ncbi:MAG: C2 family cysteine protease [Polyangiaceae bacterium]